MRFAHSVPPQDERHSYDRIVVGVDPPAGAGETADACGIVVAGSRGEATTLKRLHNYKNFTTVRDARIRHAGPSPRPPARL